jgi:hypothetical protein
VVAISESASKELCRVGHNLHRVFAWLRDLLTSILLRSRFADWTEGASPPARVSEFGRRHTPVSIVVPS